MTLLEQLRLVGLAIVAALLLAMPTIAQETTTPAALPPKHRR